MSPLRGLLFKRISPLYNITTLWFLVGDASFFLIILLPLRGLTHENDTS